MEFGLKRQKSVLFVRQHVTGPNGHFYCLSSTIQCYLIKHTVIISPVDQLLPALGFPKNKIIGVAHAHMAMPPKFMPKEDKLSFLGTCSSVYSKTYASQAYRSLIIVLLRWNHTRIMFFLYYVV